MSNPHHSSSLRLYAWRIVNTHNTPIDKLGVFKSVQFERANWLKLLRAKANLSSIVIVSKCIMGNLICVLVVCVDISFVCVYGARMCVCVWVVLGVHVYRKSPVLMHAFGRCLWYYIRAMHCTLLLRSLMFSCYKYRLGKIGQSLSLGSQSRV